MPATAAQAESGATLGNFLDTLAQQHRARIAVFDEGQSFSFDDLAHRSRNLARSLAAQGVGKSSRVGLLLPNCADWLTTAFAVWRLGATLVPLNTLWRAGELRQALHLADVSLLLMAERFLNHDYPAVLKTAAGAARVCAAGVHAQHFASLPYLQQVMVQPEHGELGVSPDDLNGMEAWLCAAQNAVHPTDAAAIFFTSGSTATPKAVVHSHRSVLAAAQSIADTLGLHPTDRTWGCMPFFFGGGLIAVALATLARGAGVIIQKVFEAGRALALMQRHGCTTFLAWPHQAQALLDHPDFAASALHLRKGVGAQATWASRLYSQDHQAVGTWGMTETGPMASATRFDDPLPERASAHGRALRGLQFTIVDPETGDESSADQVGELTVRGIALMDGYYKQPRSAWIEAGGFFRTGDLARIDERGLLHFAGRCSEIIKTAGANVAAEEIEATLMQHSAVKVAYAVGVADPVRGENPAAFVVPVAPVDPKDLATFCAAHLAAYKVPKSIFLLKQSEVPVLGSGKVDKARLREMATQRVGG